MGTIRSQCARKENPLTVLAITFKDSTLHRFTGLRTYMVPNSQHHEDPLNKTFSVITIEENRV